MRGESRSMKQKRKVQMPETIRSRRGMRIVGTKEPKKENTVDTSISQRIMRKAQLHRHFQVGEVYAFDVNSCISDQLADGTQQTKYNLKDKQGEKHSFYCDYPCFLGKKEVYLRIKEISGGQLKFENSLIERLDEIFLEGVEYEFEVISCINKRCVVCDVQIGKNHHLAIDDGQHYERGEILKLEVLGFNDKGDLLLVDRNPPPPSEPSINPLQLMAEAMEKSPKRETPQVPPNQISLKPARYQAKPTNLNDTPKVAPSFAIPRENKRILVEDLGYKMPDKAEKHVPRSSDPKPAYTRSVTQPQVKPRPKHQEVQQPVPLPMHEQELEPHPLPQLELEPEHQPEHKPDAQPIPLSVSESGHPAIPESELATEPLTILKPEPTPEPPAIPKEEMEPKSPAIPQSESPPELLPEMDSMPQPCSSSILAFFMAWMDGVPGMEQTEDYTVCSGHIETAETTELPAYQLQDTSVADDKEDHIQTKPWYARLWQFINRYFNRN